MSQGQVMASKPRISIIGAGIAGLSLACRLSRIGIPFTIYEARKEHSIGHNYAITLKRQQWRSLVKEVLGKTVQQANVFRQDTACDRLIGGKGQISDESKANSAAFQAVDKDVRNWLVQRLVEKDIRINWEHKLVDIREAKDGRGALLRFENTQETVADIIIDSGGLGSPSFGQNLPQPAPPKLLPYATYYGTRRISVKDFEGTFANYFGAGNIVKSVPNRMAHGTPFICVQKVHLLKDSATADNHTVELRWVFSRPPRDGSDPLYRPQRAKEEAKVIPDEFFQEIVELLKQNPYSKNLNSLASKLFNLADLHNDRVLNWHLRLQLPPYEYFANNSDRGSYQMFALGDASHGLPILESRGAMVAMDDAKALAQSIQNCINTGGSKIDFYEGQALYGRWVAEARAAVQRLHEIHGQELLTDDELNSLVGKSLHTDLEDSDRDSSDDSQEDSREQQQSKI